MKINKKDFMQKFPKCLFYVSPLTSTKMVVAEIDIRHAKVIYGLSEEKFLKVIEKLYNLKSFINEDGEIELMDKN